MWQSILTALRSRLGQILVRALGVAFAFLAQKLHLEDASGQAAPMLEQVAATIAALVCFLLDFWVHHNKYTKPIAKMLDGTVAQEVEAKVVQTVTKVVQRVSPEQADNVQQSLWNLAENVQAQIQAAMKPKPKT